MLQIPTHQGQLAGAGGPSVWRRRQRAVDGHEARLLFGLPARDAVGRRQSRQLVDSFGVGDRHVEALSPPDLRAQIALVLQEPIILPTTVAQNISYGKPLATMEEIGFWSCRSSFPGEQ